MNILNILIAACGFAWSDVGGAQRVAAEFSNAMVQRGHHVMVIFENKRQRPCFYKLDPRLQLCDVYREYGVLLTSCYAVWQKIIREILHGLAPKCVNTWNLYCGCLGGASKGLNKRLKIFKPDVIISFYPEATAALENLSLQIPIISMLHFDPLNLKGRPLKVLRALSRVQNQVLLPYMQESFKQIIPDSQVVDIPNAVPQYMKTADLRGLKNVYRLVYVARLSPYKQQRLLIESFAKIAESFPDWILELWGQDDGSGHLLKRQIQEYHLENKIFLKGVTSDVKDVYLRSDLLAFASIREGFGLGLAEAMSAGLPAVGVKECQAASVLIDDGVNGLLAENSVDDFAAKLSALMKDQDKRVIMGAAAHQSMRQFSPDIVYSKWETLMYSVIEREKHESGL